MSWNDAWNVLQSCWVSRKNHITSPVISPSWPTLGTSWNSWSIGYSVPNGWHTKVSRMPMAPVIPFARWTMTFKVHHQRSVHLAMHFSLDQLTVRVFILLWKGSDLVTAWFQSCFRPGILEKTLSNVSTYLPTCCPKEVWHCLHFDYAFKRRFERMAALVAWFYLFSLAFLLIVFPKICVQFAMSVRVLPSFSCLPCLAFDDSLCKE